MNVRDSKWYAVESGYEVQRGQKYAIAYTEALGGNVEWIEYGGNHAPFYAYLKDGQTFYVDSTFAAESELDLPVKVTGGFLILKNQHAEDNPVIKAVCGWHNTDTGYFAGYKVETILGFIPATQEQSEYIHNWIEHWPPA
jgi:hypothetical protein